MTKKRKNKKQNSRYLRRSRISPLKLLFWLVLICLSIFVFYMMYRFFFDKSYNLPSVAEEPSKVKELKNSTNTPEEKVPEEKPEETSPDNSDGKTPVQNDGADPNSLESLTGNITSANKVGNNLVLRVNIDQYLSSGTCVLRLENSGATVEKTANILPTASTSSCEGFDIPLSELSGGYWNIVLSLESGEKTGEIRGGVNL